MKNLVFIPAYNCETQIERVFERFTNENLKHISEILVVDNQSTDGTFKKLQQIKNTFFLKKMTLIQNPSNVGFGGSNKVAFRYALNNHFDYCIILHGDDQARLDDFKSEIAGLTPESGFIFGSRFSWQSKTYGYQKHRIWGNWFFNLLASLKFRRIVPDIGGSGLNIYDVKKLTSPEGMIFEKFPNDLTFHVELSFYLFDRNYPVRYVPISWHELDQVSNIRLIKHSIALLKLFWKHTTTSSQPETFQASPATLSKIK